MDRTNCVRLFGSRQITKIELFRINSRSGVDFGDHLHIGGSPQGDALVCWLRDGRVAVLGVLFSDNFRDPQVARVEVRFRQVGVESTVWQPARIATQGGFVGSISVNFTSPAGNWNRVELRLKRTLPDAPGGPVTNAVAEKLFNR